MKGGRKSGKWEGIEQRPRVVGTRKKRIIGISLKIRRIRYKGKSNGGRGQVVWKERRQFVEFKSKMEGIKASDRIE